MSQTKVTFYCERIGDEFYRVSDIKKILAAHGVSGANISDSTGIWQGTTEPSFELEIVGSLHIDVARAIAAHLAKVFHQDAVLFDVVKLETFELVQADGTNYTNEG